MNSRDTGAPVRQVRSERPVPDFPLVIEPTGFIERSPLQIDSDETSQLQLVEEKVEPEILSANLQRNLAANESKSHAQPNQELAQMRQELPLQVSLLRLFRESQEIEIVRVLDNLLGEIGLWRRKGREKLLVAFPWHA